MSDNNEDIEYKEEYEKCQNNPYYFCTKYLRIYAPDGKVVPYITTMNEKEFNEYFKNLKSNH